MSLSTSIGNFVTKSKPKYIVAGIIAANMAFRPVITMSNKQIPEDTRKYTATREFCTELFGMINLFAVGTLFEYLGGQITAKKLTGKFLNNLDFKNIGKNAVEALSPNHQKIKTGISVASFVGSVLSSAVFTPLANNVVLNKLMNKIIGKKGNKNKLPESISVNLVKPVIKEENIFDKYNKFVKN